MDREKLLTVDELARRLDIGHEKVRELAREGRIPCLHVGKTMRFVWAEVCDALRPKAATAPREPQA
jgi:excisionase family DNA binding protein